MSAFKILSLDGGGSWALIQVMALIDCFTPDTTGHEVLRHYDLVAANSGGGIVLGGLIKNFKLHELLQLLADPKLNKRREIFVAASVLQDPAAYVLQSTVGIGPKYDAPSKLIGLKSIFGPEAERTLPQISLLLGNNANNRPTQFLICAFDYDMNREVYFRSDQSSLAGSFGQHATPTVAQAIHASSNAPVNYFDAPARFSDPQLGGGARRYWDGALGGYNNPVFAAIVEVLTNASRYATSAKEIAALSIGTGSVALPRAQDKPHEDPLLVQPHLNSKIPVDLRKLATSILDDPPDAATFHGHIALGAAVPSASGQVIDNGPIVRMNPLVQPVPGAGGVWALPQGLTRGQFKDLCGLDMDAVEQPQVDLVTALCASWLKDGARNQPIRANGTTLDAEIGHSKYSLAKASARMLGLI